jgi:hypothetical protein
VKLREALLGWRLSHVSNSFLVSLLLFSSHYLPLTLNVQCKTSLKTAAEERSSHAPAGQFSGPLVLGRGTFQPSTFGYTGRPSNKNRGLANVWDLSGDYQFTHSFAATLYYGHAWGKGVISAIYPKNADGQLIFLETNLRF